MKKNFYYQKKNNRKELTDVQLRLLKLKAEAEREQAQEDIEEYNNMSDNVPFGKMLEMKRKRDRAVIFLGKKKH